LVEEKNEKSNITHWKIQNLISDQQVFENCEGLAAYQYHCSWLLFEVFKHWLLALMPHKS